MADHEYTSCTHIPLSYIYPIMALALCYISEDLKNICTRSKVLSTQVTTVTRPVCPGGLTIHQGVPTLGKLGS